MHSKHASLWHGESGQKLHMIIQWGLVAYCNEDEDASWLGAERIRIKDTNAWRQCTSAMGQAILG